MGRELKDGNRNNYSANSRNTYQRLVNTAHAQRRPIEEVIVHALQVGVVRHSGMMYQRNSKLTLQL